jgi:hypothetical protein
LIVHFYKASLIKTALSIWLYKTDWTIYTACDGGRSRCVRREVREPLTPGGDARETTPLRQARVGAERGANDVQALLEPVRRLAGEAEPEDVAAAAEPRAEGDLGPLTGQTVVEAVDVPRPVVVWYSRA